MYSYLGQRDLKGFINCFPNRRVIAVNGRPEQSGLGIHDLMFLGWLQAHIIAVDTGFNPAFLQSLPTLLVLEVNLKMESLEDFHTVRCYLNRAADWVKEGQQKKLQREVRLLLDEFICGGQKIKNKK
ncbi:unnamed protein product [Ambrosiozyma monospora]|uniref:Unnamed protein product n=1 Tax=Ambrosiozyma monospora TaxID=43982 RepID=A0ACB5TBT5_AMBMO|nr:unnamed protein product [Ambrosiozyma monospora]